MKRLEVERASSCKIGEPCQVINKSQCALITAKNAKKKTYV